MLSKELQKKIRHIEIQTRKLLSGTLVGDYSSARKGTGFEFDQIREYQPGDDVRFIDWKSSARMNKILIKQCVEERTRTIFLVVDGSASTRYCSAGSLKSDVIAQVASVLAVVADYGKDHAGLVLFADEVYEMVPPGGGTMHTRAIMEKLFTPAHHQGTSIKTALQHILKLKKHDAVVFIISDFVDTDFEKELRMLAASADVVAVRCLDAHEKTFPSVGLVPVKDPETGATGVLATQGAAGRMLNKILSERNAEQEMLFKRCAIDLLDVNTQREFIGDIIRFFRRRMMY